MGWVLLIPKWPIIFFWMHVFDYLISFLFVCSDVCSARNQCIWKMLYWGQKCNIFGNKISGKYSRMNVYTLSFPKMYYFWKSDEIWPSYIWSNIWPSISLFARNLIFSGLCRLFFDCTNFSGKSKQVQHGVCKNQWNYTLSLKNGKYSWNYWIYTHAMLDNICLLNWRAKSRPIFKTNTFLESSKCIHSF